MKKRHTAKKMLNRVMAMALAVMVAIPTNFCTVTYAAELDTDYASGEDDNNSTIADTVTSIDPVVDISTAASTTESSGSAFEQKNPIIEVPSTSDTEEGTPEADAQGEGDDEEDGGDEDADPDPASTAEEPKVDTEEVPEDGIEEENPFEEPEEEKITHPELYEGMIYSNCDGYSFEDILAMAEDGLDLEEYFKGNVLEDLTVEMIQSFIDQGITIEEVLAEYVKQFDPVPESQSTGESGGISLMAIDYSQQYGCISCSQTTGQTSSSYYMITMSGSVQAVCLNRNWSMSTGTRFYSASYSDVKNNSGAAITATQYNTIRRLVYCYLNSEATDMNATQKFDFLQAYIWATMEGNPRTSSTLDTSTFEYQMWASQQNLSGHTNMATVHFYVPVNGGSVQSVVTWNSPTPIEIHYYSAFQLTKVDSLFGTPVTDAQFDVYQWNETTNSYDRMGSMTLSDADTGTYTSDAFEWYGDTGSPTNAVRWWKIEEVSAGSTHAMPSDTTVWEESGVVYYESTEEATSNRTNASASGSITNAPLGVNISLTKQDSASHVLIPGATFTVSEWDNTTSSYRVLGNMADNGDGTYTMDGVSINQLAPSGATVPSTGTIWYSDRNEGWIKVEETAAPAGYVYDPVDHYSQEFCIKTDLTGGASVSEGTYSKVLTYDNEVANKGYVQISKVDAQTGRAIASNATFTIYEYNVATGAYEVNASNALTMTRNTTSDAIYRSTGGYNGDGALLYQQSNGGRYKIVETGTPSGYIGNFIASGDFATRYEYYVVIEDGMYNGGKVSYDAATNTYHIPNDKTASITHEDANYWDTTVTDNFINEAAWGKLTIYKQDQESGAYVGQQHSTLIGATYGLIPAADVPYPDGQSNVYTAVTKDTVSNLLTEIKGQEAIVNDTTGTYTSSQITAARSKLQDAQNRLLGYCVATAVTKDLGDGRVGNTLVRKDLAGTEFENRLYLGSYYLVEVSPSTGYLQSDAITDITLTYQNDTTIEVVSEATVKEQVIKQAFQIVKLKQEDGQTEIQPLAGAEFRVVSDLDLDRISNAQNLGNEELLDAVKAAYRSTGHSGVTTSYDLSMVPNALVYNENDENGKLIFTGTPNEYRVAPIVSGTDGFAYSPELPYGRYVVWESKVPENGLMDIQPFVVTIDKDGVAFRSGSNADHVLVSDTRSYQALRFLNDSQISAYLKIVKRDATTQMEVLMNAAAYKIYDIDNDKYVSMKVFYPNEATIDTFETNAEGYLITPMELPSGRYRLEEVKAPVGYVRVGFEAYYDVASGSIVEAPERALEFEISMETEHYVDPASGKNVMVVVINQYNEEQVGAVEILKLGERLTGTEEYAYTASKEEVAGLREDVDAMNTQFTYANQPLEGVEFDIIAAEDIYTLDMEYDWERLYADYPQYEALSKTEFLALDDETLDRLLAYRTLAEYKGVTLTEGAVAATIVTGEDGYARLADLPVGHYLIREIQTLPEFVLPNKDLDMPFTVTADDTVSVLLHTETIENVRKKFNIVGIKKNAEEETLSGAVFGIYADEDIYDFTGDNLLVKKDTLLEIGVTGSDGTVSFALDAPAGCAFHLEEIAAPYGYEQGVEEDLSFVTALDTEITDGAITSEVTEEGSTIKIVKYDQKWMGKIKVIKLDEGTGIPLKGVKFQLLDEEGNVLEVLETDDNGEAMTLNEYPIYTYIDGNVAGKRQYVLHEYDSVFGYHITDTEIPVPDVEDWDDLNPIIVVTITNRPNEVRISKKSVTSGEDIKGAILTVIDEATGDIVDSWETDGSDHVIKGMEEGTYRLVERRAAFGYVVAADIIFEVKDSEVVTNVTMYDEEVQGQLRLKKVDVDGNPLPGTTFIIKDENGEIVDELVCDEEGVAVSKLLPAFVFDADGTYQREFVYTLQEVKAADGYRLDEREFPFSFRYVDDHTPIVYMGATVTNLKLPETPKTGDPIPLGWVFAFMLLSMMFGTMIFMIRSKDVVPEEMEERQEDVSEKPRNRLILLSHRKKNREQEEFSPSRNGPPSSTPPEKS